MINKMKMYNVHANFSYARNLILYIHIQKMYKNKARIFNEYYEQIFEQIDKFGLNAKFTENQGLFLVPIC